MSLDLIRTTQLLQNVLSENFTQLDTHLVIRVDTPYSSLNMNLMFIQGDQTSQSAGRKSLEQDRVGWFVAFKDL